MTRIAHRAELAAALSLSLVSATACMDPDAPGNLVPATVEDDPSLPRIEVGGTTLHAEAFGDPSAPMIMMLHGGPGGDYRSLLPYRVLADDGYYARADLGDYRVRATVGLPLGGEHWKVAGWVSPTLRGTENAASDMAALGVDLRLTGGCYARRCFAAGEVGLDWVAATHVTFSDAYRRVYPGAKDGWYRLPGGTVYAGIQGGVSFSSFDVAVRAGHPRTTALQPQTLPFYLTSGVNMALPL